MINDVNVLVEEITNVNMEQLKSLGDRIRKQAKTTAALFATKQSGKLNLVCVITDDLLKAKSLKAGDLVKEAAKVAGGSGGGRPHLATAGAKDTEKLPQVFARFKELISEN